MRDAVRVALLARPGAGADRLRAALAAAGAELVLEADPTTLEPAALASAGAGSVVVLLDAAVEDALDRLDPVLHDPGIDVLYEEAALAAAREGWDAARWTRHLSAKLMRHGDVLPPGREADGEAAPRIAQPARPAAAPAPPAPAPPAPEPAAPERSMPERSAPQPPAPPPAAAAPSMFDPVAAEYDPATATDTDTDTASPGDPPLELDVPEPPATAAPAREPETEAGAEAAQAPDWSALTLSLEGDESAPPAPSASPTSPAVEASPTPAAPAPPQPPAAATPDAPPPRSDALRDFRRDLASIEQRIASMGLVEQAPPATEAPADASEAQASDVPAAPTESPAPGPAPAEAPAAGTSAGAVLVFAGIGGPDAVRQFLGALPQAFPRPVLVHQRLDGGRHDRLVQQMARATTLPVHLAADGEAVAPGHVYILPPGLRLAGGTEGLRFAEGDDPIASLPAAGSAVLMFSGSDTSLVDAAMGHAQAGAMVAGQSPEDCYDAAASDALVARGAESGQPAELARRLAERWAA